MSLLIVLGNNFHVLLHLIIWQRGFLIGSWAIWIFQRAIRIIVSDMRAHNRKCEVEDFHFREIIVVFRKNAI